MTVDAPTLVRGLKRRPLPREIEAARERIRAIAWDAGLRFCETVFEMCSFDEINMIASYGGFPTRYPHWRFGMEYLRMKKGYEWGLQKIYEMVINTEPAYAYLLDNNLLTDQKLVIAHVFAHVDFFQNNAWFEPTDRKMLDEMANHAARVRRLVDRHGEEAVEAFLDRCLSLENLVDPHALHVRRPPSEDEPAVDTEPQRLPSKSYMDRFVNPPDALRADAQRRRKKAEERRFPRSPERDVLLFLLEHAPLERWQADLLAIVREEACYFAPQGQTKIMNEGWATFWHTRLMTRHILTDAEVVDYADHHAGTVATRPGQLNPYKLGLDLFRDIEERWDKGRFGKDWLECDDPGARASWDTGAGLGLQKVFEVRRDHNDVSFVDAFLTEDFCREHGLFAWEYDPASRRYLVDTREFRAVKEKLLFLLTNHGQPRIAVTDANRANRGELELTHVHEGVDLQLDWARETLGNVARIWGRPVCMLTRVEDREAILSHDGDTFTAQGIPRPRRESP